MFIHFKINDKNCIFCLLFLYVFPAVLCFLSYWTLSRDRMEHLLTLKENTNLILYARE